MAPPGPAMLANAAVTAAAATGTCLVMYSYSLFSDNYFFFLLPSYVIVWKVHSMHGVLW